MNLPVDFEEKVRLPPREDGKGYPYKLSAKDLMQNFRYAALQVGEGLTEEISPNGIRTVTLDGGGGDELPDGNQGDMLYWETNKWVLLPSPPLQTSQEIPVMTHTGFIPEWKALEIKTLQYVGNNNTAETADFYITPIPAV